jgi:hypothetical protein
MVTQMAKFEKGKPRPPNAGRKRGTRNKFGSLLKEAFVRGAAKAGDPRDGNRGGLIGYLTYAAVEYTPQYIGALGKLLPHEVEVGLKADIRHRTAAEIDEDLEDLGFPIEEIATLLLEARPVDEEPKLDEAANDRSDKQVGKADSRNQVGDKQSEEISSDKSNNDKSEGEPT